jgi:3-hydroxyacyl-CoA dehydrogenase
MTETTEPAAEAVRTEMIDNIAVVIVDSPPVNALSKPVRVGLDREIERAAADPAVAAIVVRCEGRTFIAGADIKELGSPTGGPSLRDVQARMDGVPKPIIAALHGTTLGGGLELSLCAHFRIAAPSTRFGLPEVKLGILPGAGGTQRMPRLIGPEKSLPLIVFGEPIKADEALALGVIDRISGEDSLAADAVAYARDILAAGTPQVRVRDRTDKLAHDPAIFARFRAEHEARLRGLDSSEQIISCIEAATRLPFEEGCQFERAAFEVLLAGEQSAAMRYQFFAQRQAGKVDPAATGGHGEFTRLVLTGPAAPALATLCATAKVPAVLAADLPGAQAGDGDVVLHADRADRWTAPAEGGLVLTRYAKGPLGVVVEVVAPQGGTAAARIAPLVRKLGNTCVLAAGQSPAERLLEAGRAGVAAARAAGGSDAALRATLADHGFADGLIDALGLAPGMGEPAGADLCDRVVYPMLAEALRLLEGKVVGQPADIDALAVLGLGWPIFRGGPAFTADRVGAGKVAERLAHLEAEPA